MTFLLLDLLVLLKPALLVMNSLLKKLVELFRSKWRDSFEGGIDLIMLETFSDSREVEIATQLALTYNLPVIVQIFGMPRGKLSDGTDICAFVRQMESLGVASVE